MTILGIDPGTDRAGYGIIKKEGQILTLVEAGVLKTAKKKGAEVLYEIKKELDQIIGKHQPDLLATEKLYFTKNQSTGIQIAEARGVILVTARERNVPIVEFAPNEVKLAVTGYGGADKRAVLKMVKLILNTPALDVLDDAADALALAIAAAK